MVNNNNFDKIAAKKADQPLRSYKIGRNDPCPCGSGKKYKKCCDRINPENPQGYYLDKIIEEKDEDIIFKTLQEGLRNYPVEPAFILPLAQYHLEKKNFDKADDLLMRAWRVMGPEMGDDFILPFANLLVNDGQISTAEEIVERTLSEKGDSLSLLLALGEVKKALRQFDELDDIIKRAEKQEPENIKLLAFKLEAFLEREDLASAFDLFYRNYDKLKDLDSLYVIKFLRDILRERFDLSVDAGEKKIKDTLDRVRQIFKTGTELDDLIERNKYDQARQKINEMKELIPYRLNFAFSLLRYYLELGDYREVISCGKDMEEYHRENPVFNQLLYRAYYNLEQYEKAEEYIKTAYENLADEEVLKQKSIFGDYLRILIVQDNYSSIKKIFNEVEPNLPEGNRFITVLSDILGHEDGFLIELLFNLKDEDPEELPMGRREILSELSFLIISYIDKSKMLTGNFDKRQEKDLREVIAKAKSEDIISPVIKYAELYLEEKELSRNERKEKVNQVVNTAAQHNEEVIVKYEALIKFGNPEQVLENPPNRDKIEEQELNSYRLLAAMKLENYEFIKENISQALIAELKEGNPVDFVLGLTGYIERDKLYRVFKKAGMETDTLDEIYRYLGDIKNKID